MEGKQTQAYKACLVQQRKKLSFVKGSLKTYRSWCIIFIMKQHIKEGMPNINELLSDYNISMNLRIFASTENLIKLPLKAKLFSAKTLTKFVSYTKYTQKGTATPHSFFLC